MTPFTLEKFSSMPIKRQHKHAARLLRECIENNSSLEFYNVATQNMLLPAITTQEEMMDRFHFHTKQADIELSESELLIVRKKDARTGASYLPIDIYLDNLRSAHNVGSIIRTTEAFRLGEIYCGGNTPSHQKIKKTSMNTHQDVVVHENMTLESLTKRPVIAIETASSAIKLPEFIFPDSFSLILGNEELGISTKGLQLADVIVEIPLFGKKNSLNVATAFAIIANHIRNAKPL